MPRSIKQERRLLSADELSLVEKSHHPALGLLPDDDLRDLRKLLRERRDRAQDIAARQRRELRGKAAPTGARPPTGDSRIREKRDFLAAALQRLNKEVARREAKAARQELIDNAKRALELRREALAKSVRPSAGRTANEGISPKTSPAYSLRNPAKLGAISQYNKNMQAKRDSK
jgi:small-conductance mechanosensitive channel